MKVVLRVGGSLLVPGDIDRDVVGVLVREITTARREHDICVVVGGGKIARKYISVAREYNPSERSLDELGILSSRLNALLLALCIKEAELLSDVAAQQERGKTPVMGGTVPGQTTDAVAASWAKEVRADVLVKVTDVEGIYTDDPKKNANARKIPKMSYEDLEAFTRKSYEAGLSSIIDPVAAGIIIAERLKVYVVGRKDMEDLTRVIRGEHTGTVIG